MRELCRWVRNIWRLSNGVVRLTKFHFNHLYVLDTIVLHLNYLVGDSPVATDYVLVISRLWYGNVTDLHLDGAQRTSQFRKRNSESYLTLYQGFPQVFFGRPKTLLCMQGVILVRRPHLQSNREDGMQPKRSSDNVQGDRPLRAEHPRSRHCSHPVTLEPVTRVDVRHNASTCASPHEEVPCGRPSRDGAHVARRGCMTLAVAGCVCASLNLKFFSDTEAD